MGIFQVPKAVEAMVNLMVFHIKQNHPNVEAIAGSLNYHYFKMSSSISSIRAYSFGQPNQPYQPYLPKRM